MTSVSSNKKKRKRMVHDGSVVKIPRVVDPVCLLFKRLIYLE